MTGCDGSEVVIRFTPLSPAGLEKNATGTYLDDLEFGRTPPRYGVSVIAGWCLAGESLDQAVARILQTTSLSGRTIAVTTGNKLREIGLDIVEDATDREPSHHLVGEDPFTEPPRVDLLASLLDNCRRSNPAWKKGAAV